MTGMNHAQEDRMISEADGQTAPLFACQQCPYKTWSIDLAERHERRMKHDVWETTG